MDYLGAARPFARMPAFDPPSLPSPLWVLGTDTDVGKTFVASRIARSWAALGAVVYRKPFQTGVTSGGQDPAADASAVAMAAGPNVAVETGLSFRAPLSPLVAAEMEGRTIDLEEMTAWCARSVPHGARLLLEPAGGVMVPLGSLPGAEPLGPSGRPRGVTFVEWASRLGIPAIVVARGGLGTLNHTLLTCAALRGHGWRIAAVVLNPGLDGSTAAAMGNAETLRRFQDAPVCVLED
jgi:dethiobiotin synthase